MSIYLQTLVIVGLFFSENTNKKDKENLNVKPAREIILEVRCPSLKNNEILKQCKVKYIQAPTEWVNIEKG